ncbi:MAG: hypothetical protein LAO23_04755 [Acidobacteriia bacterium]|nr:hypothetical protein [Terriglobia bacterium]
MEPGIATLGQALISRTMIGQTLIATWTLVAVAFIALVILLYVAIRSRTRRIDLEGTVQAFRSLDIEAFRNLVDPAEEAFLRNHLPLKKFRDIKRQRAWAAFLYAWEAGRAATALAKVGQAAQRSLDPEIAASGAQVTENAFRLRLQSLRVGLRLLTEVLLPGLSSRSLPSLADQYERAAQTLFRLGRFPARAPKLARSKTA